MSRWIKEKRPPKPKAMQIQARDYEILEKIHAYDGILTNRQISKLFFENDTSGRGASRVTQRLWENGYIARAIWKQRVHFGSIFYWLDQLGAASVASRLGQDPKTFKYRREPKALTQLPHELVVGDFRVNVELACRQYDIDVIWTSEAEFRSNPDQIKVKNRRVKVYPDGCIFLRPIINDKTHRFRFLLEIDMGTEDNPRIGRDKVDVLLQYVASPEYEARFGDNFGQILMVTERPKRLANMKETVERYAGKNAQVFLFAVRETATPETLFTEPIWYRGGSDNPTTLFST